MFSVLYHLDWCEKHGERLPRGVIMLLPTSIFRTGADLANMVSLFETEKNCSSVVAVCRDSGIVRASRTVTRDGFLSAIKGVTSTEGHLRRQEAGEFYRINGCAYLASPAQLRRHKSYINVPSAVPYVMNSFSAVDIDTQQDLAMAGHLSSVLVEAIENNSSFARAESAGKADHIHDSAPL